MKIQEYSTLDVATSKVKVSEIVNVTFYLKYIFYTKKNVIPPTARSLYQIYIILAEGVTEFQNFIITQVFVFSRASLGPAVQAPKLSRKPAAAGCCARP